MALRAATRRAWSVRTERPSSRARTESLRATASLDTMVCLAWTARCVRQTATARFRPHPAASALPLTTALLTVAC
eukprot:1331360-Rhodomonas_salina.2